MNTSENRRMKELVDAVVVGMSDSNEDQLFEAFINCPNLRAAEQAICSEEDSERRDKLRATLESSLNDDAKAMLSKYDDLTGDRFGAEARFYFDAGVRLGRLLEQQRREDDS